MEALIMAFILKYSVINDIDPRLVMAVVQVESAYNPKAKGPVGEIGLMQLRPNLYPKHTVAQLYDIETNIRLGTEHLATHMRHCSHGGKLAVICYNLGVRGAKRIKNPTQFPYYKKVSNAYKRMPRNPIVLSKWND